MPSEGAVPDEGLRVETRLAVLGRGGHRTGRPLNVPIIPASNFRASASGGAGREYARDDGTPGWEALEELVGDLEGGPAVCFSSGMAAIAAVLDLLPVGARVVVPRDSYTALRGLLEDGAAAGGRWLLRTVDMTRADELAAAVRDADLVWLETPSNPLLEVVDIAEVAAMAAEFGALVAVDNTFATPLLQAPLELGANFVVHSATKFIGGHSDLLLGAVVCRRPDDQARLVRRREVAGAVPGALECFLALRGARTLALRLRQAQDSAGELAGRLQAHPAVSKVRYRASLSTPTMPAPPVRCAGSERCSASRSATPTRRTPSAPTSRSSRTPPASVVSSQPSNGGRSYPAKIMSPLVCSASVSAVNTSRTCGPISPPRWTPPDSPPAVVPVTDRLLPADEVPRPLGARRTWPAERGSGLCP